MACSAGKPALRSAVISALAHMHCLQCGFILSYLFGLYLPHHTLLYTSVLVRLRDTEVSSCYTILLHLLNNMLVYLRVFYRYSNTYSSCPSSRHCYSDPSLVLSWGNMYLKIISEEASSVPVSAGCTD
jgi:hypothetical protein